jgi:zinc protease
MALLKARLDNPEAVAGVVFPRLLYGAEHPYGRPDLGTPRTVERLTRDDVVAFHKRLYLPNNASLIVAGDTTPEAITATLEGALKGWMPGEPPRAVLPEPSTGRPVTVYLVDKPGAAQSVLAVGQVGQPRSTPDYFPLSVMNEILGGQFSSRINLNLREDKGYSYGASSHFAFRLGPGPFQAGGAVQTDVTKEALVELIKELTDITGARPVSDAELEFAKEQIIRGFPARFETTSDVAGTLAELVLYGLPDDYFANYTARADAVTRADVNRVARKYLDPGHFTILIVGDRARVEPALKTLPYARVVNVLDLEGNPLPIAAPGTGAGSRD